jgi:CheY-like chemotaxis protein
MQDSILLVEDSPEDFETAVRAFQKAGWTNPIFRCADGEQALDYLFRRENYADPVLSPRPRLILLDLNLPGTDGREVLATIKKDLDLKSIPVLVLTTSADVRDIVSCYQAGVNCYMKKPVDLGGFMESVRKLVDFWFNVAILPQEQSA